MWRCCHSTMRHRQLSSWLLTPCPLFNGINVADGRYEQRTIWARSIIDYRINDNTTLKNTLYDLDSQRDYRNLETSTTSREPSALQTQLGTGDRPRRPDLSIHPIGQRVRAIQHRRRAAKHPHTSV